jgi:hypothetical protein
LLLLIGSGKKLFLLVCLFGLDRLQAEVITA